MGTSEAGSSVASHRGECAEDTCKRLSTLLAHTDTLSSSAHLRAARSLCKLRDQLDRGKKLSHNAQMLLLSCGLAMQRRFSVGENIDEDEESADDAELRAAENEASRELVGETTLLIYLILCMSERQRLEEAEEEEDEETRNSKNDRSRLVIGTVSASSLWDIMCKSTHTQRKRARLHPKETSSDGASTGQDQGGEAEETPESEEDSKWAEVLRSTDDRDIAKCALTLGASFLEDESHVALKRTMPIFFRASSLYISRDMFFGKSSSADFATFESRDAVGTDRDKKLLNIASAAESEAGQQVIRDILLSFLLPSGVVQSRRVLLLARTAQSQASENFQEHVARAHDVAMGGAEWFFQNGTDELERMCCLLGGIAMLTTKRTKDMIRKNDAFGGQVQLPFFETRPPDEPSTLRLALVASENRWVLYRLSKKNNMMRVIYSKCGFEGFCDAALQLVAALKK